MGRNQGQDEPLSDEELDGMEEKISEAFDEMRESINKELKKQRSELPDDTEYSHDFF